MSDMFFPCPVSFYRLYCCLLKFKNLVIILLVLLFSACAQLPKHWDPQGYTVKQGDTLYSIAWRYEKDFQLMVRINNLRAPYAIYPGQRLRMNAPISGMNNSKIHTLLRDKSGASKRQNSKVNHSRGGIKKNRNNVKVQRNETLYAIALREGYSLTQLAQWNHLNPPYVIYKGQSIRLHPVRSSHHKPSKLKSISKPPAVTHKLSAPVTSVTNARPLALKVKGWHWPVNGRVVQTFKNSVSSRKGIGIKGRTGQPIKAAASGSVVYSGNGLINYGNLIIIKHSHTFLSAYAYNQSLLVKEGDFVKQGQMIAKMGNFNAKPLLHFEIRKNGKPVNPLKYLPKM